MVFTGLGFLQQACTTIPTELKDAHIASPGDVLVNYSLWKKKQLDDPGNWCIWGAFPVDPFTTVEAPSGYGLDERYEIARKAMIEMGTSCLSGSDSHCQSIIEMMENWAKVNAAQVKSSHSNGPKYWNDTLTVNLRIVRPFLGAYSIAKATVNTPTETDELIHKWMHRTVKRASHLMRTADIIQNKNSACGIEG